MRNRIILIVICLTLFISSVCSAKFLLNSDWDYIGKGYYGNSTTSENMIYCNRKSVQQFKNGNIRLVVCYYFPPNNVMSKDEVYVLYDFEINGKDRLFMTHNFEIVQHDGKKMGAGLPRVTSGWEPFSTRDVQQRLFERYCRR